MRPIDLSSTPKARPLPATPRSLPASHPPEASLAAPQDGVEIGKSSPSRWKEALGLTLMGTGMVALQAVPWVGAALMAGSLLPLSGRLSQIGQGLNRMGEAASQRLTGFITQQVVDWRVSYTQEPTEGPARDEFRLQKILRRNEQQFGKDSIYNLSNHLSLAQHYQDQRQGIEASEHFQKALMIFEGELKERGGVDSLHGLVATSIPGKGEDAASLYQHAAGFFQLYGGAEKARPLLERALELCPADAGRERRSQIRSQLADLHVQEGQPEKGLPYLQESWKEALEELPPNHADLGSHTESLARVHRQMGQNERSEDFWALSLGLGQSKSSISLNLLAKQYAKLGHGEQAFDLRQQSEILQLEESTAKMGAATPQLAKDLGRLQELYAYRGDESAQVRVSSRLAVVQTRLAARGPLLM